MKIFITGGAGYIGSHTCIELLSEGYDVVVYDDLSNSSLKAIERIEKITDKSVDFIEGNVRDENKLSHALEGSDAVIHFAGFKAVGESVEKPLDYYGNNVQGTLCLLNAMRKNDIKKIVFSSSATVYGDPDFLPLTEGHPLRTTNPYGRTKLIIEDILRDLYVSDDSWSISILRYFNPVGAHKSGTIGEDPQGIPNNLMPFITQVAIKKRKYLSIFGNDYDTHDGTGVRDYIHVVDLAKGHVRAIQILNKPRCEAINLGTGNGYSVLDMVNAFSKASGRQINYKIMPRRPGDIAKCYADATKAKQVLDWKATKGIDEMCRDSWNWQSKNPNGYN